MASGLVGEVGTGGLFASGAFGPGAIGAPGSLTLAGSGDLPAVLGGNGATGPGAAASGPFVVLEVPGAVLGAAGPAGTPGMVGSIFLNESPGKPGWFGKPGRM